MLISGILLSTSAEQLLDFLCVALPHCYIKRSPSIFILGIQLGASAEQRFDFVCIPLPRC